VENVCDLFFYNVIVQVNGNGKVMQWLCILHNADKHSWSIFQHYLNCVQYQWWFQPGKKPQNQYI